MGTMDSNGRQRMSSSPGVTLPTSSTFRRLPGIGRGPFRRDKASTPPAVEPNASTLTPTSTHQRGSTYPSNVRLSTDDHISYVPPNHHRNGSPDGVEIMRDGGLNQQSANLSLPSRTSSLPLTPVAPEDLTRFAPPDDLAPITYPSHLAQTRAPDSQSSIPASTSIPIPPLQASTSGRQREFTLGNGTLPLGPVIGDTTRRVDPRERHADGVLTEDTDRANVPQASSSMAKGDPNERVTSKAVDNNAAKKDVEDDGENPPRRRRAATKSSVMPKEDGGHSRKSTATKVIQSSAGPRIPQLPQSKTITGRVPTAAMYFSALPTHGHAPEQPLRAHTGTLVRDKIWFLGGVDGKICWRGVAWFDTETLCWSSVETYGERLPPLRAHTTTLVGSRLYIFGGGDGPTYSNDVWTFDTVTHRFSRPNITSSVLPPPRRAHTTILYGHYLVVFGGGNGQAALNDVWALDVSDSSRLTWQEWATSGKVPQKKGYHTANLVGSKMIVFGGSDGHASFADIHVLDLESLVWTLLSTEIQHNRLSHTSTQVGSYLFVVGGHNGSTYAQDVLLFNLVTLQWETKVPKGTPPPGRGYHVATLHDARLFISGGYNGVKVFDDFWVLDLSAAAYLPQVTTFEVDETANMA